MTAKCDWTHTQTNDRKLVMWSDTDRGSEPPLTSLDVIHPGQTAVKVGMLRQPTSHPNVRERLSTRDCLKSFNELKWLKTLKLIKTYSVIHIWTFLCTVNAWCLSNCLRRRGVYFVPKMHFLLCLWGPCVHSRYLSDTHTRSVTHMPDLYLTHILDPHWCTY